MNKHLCVFISNTIAPNNGVMALVGIPFEMQLAHNVFVKFHGYGRRSSQNTHALCLSNIKSCTYYYIHDICNNILQQDILYCFQVSSL
jgi:hypothetical protein